MKRQSGFTLVEIAIVLVVIGLLLGGVLKGQELVLNSRVRNAINEYNNVASATFAYQDRYRQIPGDDDTAMARWDTPANPVVEGDRNGLIDGGNNYPLGTPTTLNDETGLFWHHLRNDQLVVGPTTGDASQALPRNAFDGFTGIEQGAYLPAAGGIVGLVVCLSNILTKPAGIIDNRIDDGAGSTGVLQLGLETGGPPAAANLAAASVDLVAGAQNNRYTMCRQL